MSPLRDCAWHAASRSGSPWRIDAWSVGDGSLFASQRDERADIWREDGGDEAETFVLRAPDFDAARVSRALAYGAVRRGAQEGFSLDGQQEQAFASLAELRELARRAYIASAIGDSGPEGDGVPPPGGPPPDGGPSPDGFTVAEAGVLEELRGVLGVLNIQNDVQSMVREKLANAVLAAMDHRLVWQAARLLVLGADFTAGLHEQGNAGLAAALLQVAAGLVGPAGLSEMAMRESLAMDTVRLAEWLTVPVWLPDRVVIGQGVLAVDPWRLLGDALLPAFPIRDALGLPPRCSAWIDALQYLGADSRYYQLCSRGEWLPLAVAAAAIATSSRGAVPPWLERSGLDARHHRHAWMKAIAQFIARMVPAAGLAPAVEGWLWDRCWSYQRKPRQGRTA